MRMEGGAIAAGCCCENEEVVLSDPERSYGDNDSSDDAADCPQVARQKQQCNFKYRGSTFNGEVKAPLLESV